MMQALPLFAFVAVRKRRHRRNAARAALHADRSPRSERNTHAPARLSRMVPFLLVYLPHALLNDGAQAIERIHADVVVAPCDGEEDVAALVEDGELLEPRLLYERDGFPDARVAARIGMPVGRVRCFGTGTVTGVMCGTER